MKEVVLNCGGIGEPDCDEVYYNTIINSRKGTRKNKDGTESTHLMKREWVKDKGWVAFPELFQDENGTWQDFGEKYKDNWEPIYQEALKRNEVYTFGEDEEAAINFADKGVWKTKNKKMAKRKKYRTGSGTQGASMKDYLPSPSEANDANSIMMAKAEAKAAANPTAFGVEFLSQLIPQFVGAGQGKIGMDDFGGSMVSAKYGMEGQEDQQVNVEGKEIVDDPTMGAQEIVGPSHDQGGVDVDMASDSNVFSDKVLDENGKTMAERKKRREQAKRNLVEMLENDKLDTAKRNAYKRKLEQFEQEEEKDLALQEQAGMLAELMGMPHTGEDGKAMYGQRKKMIFGGRDPIQTISMLKSQGVEIPEMSTSGADDFFSGDLPVSSENSVPENSPQSITPQLGDLMKLAGNAYGAFSQMKNVENSRAGDKPHPNHYKDVGDEAVKTLEGSKGDLDAMKANQESKARRETQSNKRAGRRSSRGINTMRATDAVSNMQLMDMERALFDSVAAQKMGIDKSIASTQASSSQVKGQGAAMARDLSDKDRGQYHTNKSVALGNVSNAMQQTGKDLNDMAQNPVIMNLINQLSKYGIFANPDGTIQQRAPKKSK